jgi:hypothetical protein
MMVVMKGTVFWVVTLCSVLKVIQRFIGTALLATCFHPIILLSLFFDPEDGGYMFL